VQLTVTSSIVLLFSIQVDLAEEVVDARIFCATIQLQKAVCSILHISVSITTPLILHCYLLLQPY